MKADGYPDVDPWVVDWFDENGAMMDRPAAYAFPILAADLSGLPPAFVMVGGCDWLRDEGLAYAERLRDAGVPTEELISKGQPHGFLNLDFPASAEVYSAAGAWLRDLFAAAG